MFPYINIFNIQISTYLLLHILAFVLNIFLLKYLSKIKYFDFFKYYILYIVLILSSFLFSRAIGDILYNSNFNLISILKNPNGETSYLGVISIFPVIVYLFSKFYDESFFRILSIFIPLVLLFQTLGKIGCLFAGCCYGAKTNCLLSIEVYSYIDHYNTLTSVHPVQIYESILYFTGLIVYFIKYNDWKDVELVSFYFMYYGFIRFFMEFIRGEIVYSGILFFTNSQLYSILIFSFGLLLYLFKYKNSG